MVKLMGKKLAKVVGNSKWLPGSSPLVYVVKKWAKVMVKKWVKVMGKNWAKVVGS